MTEDHEQLLRALEVKVNGLIALCDSQAKKIHELNSLLAVKEDKIQQGLLEITALKTKCDNMLTARVVSVNENEVKSAKMRLSKLVREVDRCIDLLNSE